MKALTVCQPYASLIVGWPGIEAADVKRVENRRAGKTKNRSRKLAAGNPSRPCDIRIEYFQRLTKGKSS